MDKEAGMKILIYLQEILMVVAGVYGALLLFSEVPLSESWIEQMKVSGGGLIILLLCAGWGFLISWEEKVLETR